MKLYCFDAIKSGPSGYGNIICDGMTDYSNRIADVVATVPQSDYILFAAAAMNVLDILECIQPGVKEHALLIKNTTRAEVSYTEIPVYENRG